MKIIKIFKKYIKSPQRIIPKLGARNLLNWIPDRLYLRLVYWCKMGKKLNLDNPKTFNEKLQWLKLNDRKPEYTRYVDKYEVRSYIRETIGEEYLIPLLGVYNSFNEIDFNKLPNQFVLKCTHDSGGVILCRDKSKLDIDATEKKINKCMRRNYYYQGREWPYKNLKPRIICEKYLEQDEIGHGLIDYKFMCFNGQAKCIFVCSNRNSTTGTNIDIYDMDWELIPCEREINTASKSIINKPTNFDLMVKFAEILAKNIPFVRVDFYEVKEKLYFGEITFFPAAGFERFVPDSYDDLFGSWISLNEVNKK